MIVGVRVFDCHLPGAQSLKEKRFVLRSLKDRIRKRFNVAVAEVGYQDMWQRCELAVAALGTEQRQVEHTLDAIRDLLDGEAELHVLSDDTSYS